MAPPSKAVESGFFRNFVGSFFTETVKPKLVEKYKLLQEGVIANPVTALITTVALMKLGSAAMSGFPIMHIGFFVGFPLSVGGVVTGAAIVLSFSKWKTSCVKQLLKHNPFANLPFLEPINAIYVAVMQRLGITPVPTDAAKAGTPAGTENGGAPL